MENIGLAPHEMLELREILDLNLLGARKLEAAMSMVSDDTLRTFMEKCLVTKKDNINSIQSFIENNLNV